MKPCKKNNPKKTQRQTERDKGGDMSWDRKKQRPTDFQIFLQEVSILIIICSNNARHII
jgi:hypothetical protein